MRVAFIRGSAVNAWELQNLPQRHEVVAFASLQASFAEHGFPVPVRRLPSPRDPLAKLPGLVQGGLQGQTGSPEYLVGLERALAGFDVAHGAELRIPYTWQALRAREAGAVKKVVATVWENIALPPAENAWVARRERRVARGVDHFLAITDRARVHLELAGADPARITVQPMGVDLQRFRPAETPRPAGGGPLELLCVARIVPEKGVEDLVIAVRLLKDEGIDARVTFAGAGPLAGRLEAMAAELGIAERVRLAGTVRYDALPDLYRASDVFVLPSAPRWTWREQFGFAAVEALACGLPVVAGDSGSLDEVVAARDSLVTPHDPVRLAEHLAGLAADPALRARQGERNRRWAEERYDRDVVAERIAQLYERVLAEG